ncbi:MAG: HAMP domain-containing sensor histidine kinase, partial [Cyanobacteria bacterium J06642_11]
LLQRYQRECPDPSPELAAALAAANVDFIAVDYPKLLNSMETGITRINRIVGSLRIFSCLDEAHHKQVDLHRHLDNTLVLMDSTLNELPITVVKDYGQIPPISCYPSHLNQVFMHLFGNAIDAFTLAEHSPVDRQPTITIRTTLLETSLEERIVSENSCEMPYVLITIMDNGPGIPEKIKPYIFDPFFSSKPVGKGTGLGLSTGYEIVNTLHRGRLEYRDVVDGGAAFDIYLPCTSSTETVNHTDLGAVPVLGSLSRQS